MTTLVKIDGQAIGVDEFFRTLKLSGQYQELIDQLVKDRLTVLDAKRRGIAVSPEEVQQRADQYRRVHGLHRAADMNRYLDGLKVGLEDFEAYVTDSLYQEKMLQQVIADAAVEEYFHLNSPKFDAVEVSHIVLDSEGAAREMVSVLTDDPEGFEAMAREHSIAATREQGGSIGRLRRGALRADVEAKLFNAQVGELLGPFASADRTVFEIFRVDARHPAKLDAETAAEVRKLLREQWLRARAQEHLIEAC